MKKVLILAMAAAVGLPFLAYGQGGGYYDRSYVRLSYVRGDVYVQRAQDLGYEQGELNLVLIEGDKIGSRDGRVEVQLGRGNYLRLDNDTLVELVALPRRDDDPSKFHLLSGRIFVRVEALDREKNFAIHTPDASFFVLDEGLYRVDILGNMETEFMVYRGQAEAAGDEGSILVREGEMIVAADGRFTATRLALRARNDDFGAWNGARDALYARRASRTYLPADYADYESELGDYGRWVYESSYGHVWVPTVSYGDWRPYYNGRWVWYPVIGWTWVSYEPWGWCTYHYGRWGWRFGLGWYWIPHRHWHWGPAWVHWWHGYDHIGWCPLSYYNYPAVIVNNYFYDRYDRGYVPHDSRTLVVVDKGQLQNRRISQVALSQNALGRVGRISLRAAQPDLRPSLNRVNDVALKAQRVLNRDGLRSVNRSSGAEARRVSPGALVGPSIRRDGGADGSEAASSRNRAAAGREIRPRGEDRAFGAVPRAGASADSQAAPGRKVESDSARLGPSRRAGEGDNARLPSVGASSRATKPDQPERKVENRGESGARPRVVKETAQPSSVRNREGEGRSPSSLPSSGRIEERRPVETQRSSVGRPADSNSRRAVTPSVSPSTRTPSSSRTIRERGNDIGIGPGLSASPRSRATIPGASAPSVRSRSSAPSDNRPSGFIGAPPSTSSAPSRSISPPSRSSGGSSPGYSAPPRGSSAPSRSVSAPPRSSSSPRSSYSAPSRSSSSSSSSSSRSVSSPSRSSSSSSRSSGSSSRSSSGSSGSVRKK